MIAINPGSGPVAEATARWSEANLHVFVEDLRDLGHEVTADFDIGWTDEGDGRWGWRINVDGHDIEIDMPGLPVDKVRYLGLEGQSIWDFPRLYVDGSSWVWKYALGVCEHEEEDEDE